MGLFEIMQEDAQRIAADDSSCGFAVSCMIDDPGTISPPFEIKGHLSDIKGSFEVGDRMITGRLISISVPFASFAPGKIPVAIGDATRSPWKVSLRGQTYKVVETDPDESAQIVVLYLEEYNVPRR